MFIFVLLFSHKNKLRSFALEKKLVLGIDFGSDSARAVVVDPSNGKELGQGVKQYPRWEKGEFCDPDKTQFRQHPKDYIESIEECVLQALKEAGPDAGSKIAGISVDATGSTPCAVDKSGTPLSLKNEFKDDPDAMFILWKDHTAIKESEDINKHSKSWGGVNYTLYSGGSYSPEWFWAKVLHVLRNNPNVREAAWTWVEQSDWLPYMLTGAKDVSKMYRSRCTAGHKAMWHKDWGGLPSEAFLSSLDPLLKGLKERLYTETYTVDTPVGKISEEWAERLGINRDAVVGAGALDAHIGGVGGGIVPGTMIKVMGTSTCDMIVTDSSTAGEKPVSGISGQVDGSIIPGLIGFEAGQSAFGDVYAWFKNLLTWALEGNSAESDNILPKLEEEAAKLPPDSSILALDWFNGRRTPDGNPLVTGAVTGLRLGDSAPKIYRALIEATAFGSKAILDRFLEYGIPVEKIIAVGGIAKKSPLVMQIMADVMNREIIVIESEQTVAAGAAMCASVVCGIHPDLPAAQKAMQGEAAGKYIPNRERVEFYKKQFEKYKRLGKAVENL